MPEQWKRDRTERDRNALIQMEAIKNRAKFNSAMRKVTAEAEKRMRRTARQQLADAIAAGFAPPNLPEPDDAEDSSIRGVMR